MAYSIRLPDGTLVDNIPDEVTPEAAKARILKSMPHLVSKERTWGEAATDIGASAVSGLGALTQLPGQLYGLATGDMEETGLLGLGKDIEKWGEERKSAGLKAREAARGEAVRKAAEKGELEAAKTAFGETLKDPALLTSFLAEQVPQLLVPGAAAKVGAKAALARGAAQEAAIGAGAEAAVGAGAVQQGADVGAGAFEAMHKELVGKGMSPEQASAEVLNKARAVGVSGAIISLLAQKLPGAQQMERIMAGERTGLGRIGGAALGALKEAPGEVVEETGGRLSQNIAMRGIKPEQRLTEGLGETAGMAALGGVGMGGVTGMLGGRTAAETPEAPPVQAPEAVPQVEAPPPLTPMEQAQQVLSKSSATADLIRAQQALLGEQQTKEVKSLREQIRDRLAQMRTADEAGTTEFPALVGQAPQQMEMREATTQPEGPAPVDAETQALLDKARRVELPPPVEINAEQLPLFNLPALDRSQAALQSQVPPEAQDAFGKIATDPNVPDSAKTWAAGTRNGRQLVQNLATATPEVAAQRLKQTKSEGVRSIIYSLYPELAPQETAAFQEKPAEAPPVTPEAAQRVMESNDPWAEVMRMQAEEAAQAEFNKQRAAHQAARVETPLQRAQREATDRQKERARWAEYEAEVTAQTEAMWGEKQKAEAEAESGTNMPTWQKSLWLQGGEGTAPTKPEVEGAPTLDQLVKDYVAAREAKNDTAMQDIADLAKEAYGAQWAKAKYEATQRRQGDLFKEPKPATPKAEKPVVQEAPKVEEAAPSIEAPPEAEAPKVAEAPPSIDPAQVVRDLQAISQREGNSDTGKRARQHLQDAKRGEVKDLDVAAAFVEDHKTAPEKPAAKAKPAEKPAAKPAEKPVEKAAVELRNEVAKLEAKIDAERAKDEPNEKILNAMEDRLSLLKRGVSSKVAKDLREAAREAAREAPNVASDERWRQVHDMLREEETLGDALNTVLQDKSIPAEARALINALLRSKSIQSASFRVVPEDRMHKGEVQNGGYNPAMNRVSLYNQGGLTALLHEAVHSAVYGAMHYDAKFKANVEAMLERAKKALGPGDYGLTNEQEFVAEAFTNPEFRDALSRIPAEPGTPSVVHNLWRKFVDAVRAALGIPTNATTLLDEVMSEAVQYMGGEFRPVYDVEAASIAPQAQAMLDAMEPQYHNPGQQLLASVKGGWNQGIIKSIEEGVTKLRTAITDKHASIEQHFAKQFNGAVRDALGKVNPMVQLRQADDAGKMMLEFFLQGSIKFDNSLRLWRVTADKNVRPPKDVYDLVKQWGLSEGKTMEKAKHDAGRILEAVRLYELRKVGAEVREHMSDAEINTLYAEYQNSPMLQEMTTLMDESRKAMVNHMEKVGRLTPEMAKEWRSVVGYVPFDRDTGLDGFDDILRRKQKQAGKGLAQLGKLPELVGSPNRPVKNAFDNYINTMGWLMQQVVRTDAVRSTLRELEGMGKAKFFPVRPMGVPSEKLVRTFVKGEEKFFMLDSAYDAAAFNDRSSPLPAVFKLMGKMSNVLRTAITAVPTFSLKQVAEDVQRAALHSGVKDVVGLTKMALANFAEFSKAEIKGEQHPAVRLFGEMALTGEYDWMSNDAAASLARDLGVEKRTLLGSSKFGNLIHKLDGITRASDLAIRKAIYDMTIKETNGDVLLAQTRAREIINFRRRGAGDKLGVLNVMVQTVPFFNAYLQGMDVLLRSATGAGAASGMDRQAARRMFWSRAGVLTAISMMYAMAGGGDDDAYEAMSLDKRDKTWVLGGGVALPVPTEVGIVFKAIPERVWDYLKRQGTPEEQLASEAITSWFRAALDTYAGRLIPLPQAMRPMFEVFTNHSFLTGRELEGLHHRNLDPSQRTNANTSELAKSVAAFTRDTVGIEVSPISIDTVLNGYFGTTTAVLTATTDALLNPDKVDRPLNKMVGMAPFTYDPVGTKYINEFYDIRDKVVRTHNTLSDLQKRDPEAAEKYVEAHREFLALNGMVNATLKQLQNTRAYRNWLSTPEAAKEMSGAKRLEVMRELQGYEQEMVRWVREAKAELKVY